MASIYIYSPSGAVRDKAAFRRGIKRLEALGHVVEVDRDALATSTRFAGDDDTRLAAIARAAASGADVALTSRGGYGITRLLERLPYDAIARAAERGTRFVGLSDFTALQLAVLAKTGARTWAGPSLCEGFGAADAGAVDEIMLACFDDVANGASEGTGWRLPAETRRALAARSGAAGEQSTPEPRTAQPPDAVLAEGATLWGGNLAMVASLLGTPYFPRVQGGVLFLEDVGEHPYRIERMLAQLALAGVLAQQTAIVLGQFTEYRLAPHDRGYSLAKVVDWLRTRVQAPVLAGLPFGHVPTKVLLPVGAPVSVVVQGGEALLLWGHLD